MNAAASLAKCSKTRQIVLYFQYSADDFSSVRSAEGNGFRFVGISLKFEKKLSPASGYRSAALIYKQ